MLTSARPGAAGDDENLRTEEVPISILVSFVWNSVSAGTSVDLEVVISSYDKITHFTPALKAVSHTATNKIVFRQINRLLKLSSYTGEPQRFDEMSTLVRAVQEPPDIHSKL